jgi:hypothetical protein
MFKKSAWIAAFLWVVLGSEVAFAYDDVNGVVEKIDIPSRQLVLDGERTYPVARGINLAKYKVGDKIALRIEDEGTKKGVVMKIILGEYFPLPLPKQNSRNRSIP